jgi:hypothetical protein
MPLCSNGQETTIEWQYLNEEKQRILEADDYSVEQELGKCPVLYHAFGTFVSKNGSAGGCNKAAWWRTQTSLNGNAVNNWQPIISSTNRWIIELNNGDFAQPISISEVLYNSNYLVNYSFGGIRYRPSNLSCTSVTNPGDGYNLVLTKLIRLDGQPDNCGGCIFKIFKSNTVIYEKIKPTCPIVNHFCGAQCPSGTCECTNGSTVCCYDPNTGIAVKSFTR